MTAGFPQRLKELIDNYKISYGELADRMGVQRSTLSHLVSGRNRPGFDFLERLAEAFPDINLNWVITGLGSITSSPVVENSLPFSTPGADFESKPSAILNFSKEIPQIPSTISSNRQLVRTILIFSDGTFEEFRKA